MTLGDINPQPRKVNSFQKILPVSDPNGCDTSHQTQSPSLARTAYTIGILNQGCGLVIGQFHKEHNVCDHLRQNQDLDG